MKIVLNFGKGRCFVTREDSDPRFSNGGYADAESTLLYHVKKELVKMGYDVIKKRMWKDGNMVDDSQQYVRSRNLKDPTAFAVYNDCYATSNAGLDFNKNGEYCFALTLL